VNPLALRKYILIHVPVNNDFQDQTGIFKVFEGLELDWDAFGKPMSGGEPQSNGNHTAEPAVNGAVAAAV
jgi:hypothetical protein